VGITTVQNRQQLVPGGAMTIQPANQPPAGSSATQPPPMAVMNLSYAGNIRPQEVNQAIIAKNETL
jgi:hypothetical protein